MRSRNSGNSRICTNSSSKSTPESASCVQPRQRRRKRWRNRKKTADAIRQEIDREIDRLMRVVFHDRRRTGRLDLAAVEMAMRSGMHAMHHAGAAAISQLRRFEAPPTTRRTLAGPCGHHALYRELHAKTILTAVGSSEVSRPYFLCPHCHHGQFPTDIQLNVKDTGISVKAK